MPKYRYIIQCDFDGTLTTEDISFHILDKFVGDNWHEDFKTYQQGSINVGQFNKIAFGRISAPLEELEEFTKQTRYERSGIVDFIEFCRSNDIDFNIVSNGLKFYINVIMERLGLSNVPVYAAEADFSSGYLNAAYYDINKNEVMEGFKESYARHFLGNGRKLIYIGNGPSDVPAAKLADKVFATGYMVDDCKKQGINHHSFENISEIIEELKKII